MSGLALLLVLSSAGAVRGQIPWVRLSDGPASSDVESFRVSPDGRWVVYRSNEDVALYPEFYRVPTDGSLARERVLPPLAAPLVGGYEFSTDGERLFFTADLDADTRTELHSMPIAGGPSQLLADAAPNHIVDLLVDPTGARIIYIEYRNGPPGSEGDRYWSIPVSGGPSTFLAAEALDVWYGVHIERPTISPDGQHLVFVEVDDTTFAYRLVSVALADGTRNELATATSFDIHPSGSPVVYVSGPDDGMPPAETGRLMAVPTGGGAPADLSPTPPVGSFISRFEIAPGGQRVVYWADLTVTDRWELYAAQIDGGGTVTLNGALASDANVDGNWAISNDGARVAFSVHLESNDIRELFSVPITGGATSRLNATLDPGERVREIRFSPDDRFVFYTANPFASIDPGLAAYWVLFRADALGPASTAKLASDLLFDVNSAWTFDPWRNRVIIRSNVPLVDGVVRPWSIPVDPIVPNETQLVPKSDFDPAGDVLLPLVVARGGSLVYRADQRFDDVAELFSLPFSIFLDGFEDGTFEAWDGLLP